MIRDKEHRVILWASIALAVATTSDCASSRNDAPTVPEGKGLLVAEYPGNVTLYVSTEGTEQVPVDLEVLLDGVPIIRGKFGEGGMHPFYVEYRFDWPLTVYELTLMSSQAESKSMTVDASRRIWIVLTFGYAPERGLGIKTFDKRPVWL